MAHDRENGNGGGKDVKAEDKGSEESTGEGNESDTNHEDENAETREKFLRLAAEFDNYKKRTANEVSAAKRMGIAEIMKPLLGVLDEFELTLIAVNGSKDERMIKGIEMLYSNFLEVLRSFGLKEIEADSTFDPYKHEIVLTREADSKPGTILEVVKKGYMLDERLLRPASVIVARERGNATDEAKGSDKGKQM